MKTASFLDLMALARRTMLAGQPGLAGQMACLAMEAPDAADVLRVTADESVSLDATEETREDADDETMDAPMLEALEQGDSAVPGGGLPEAEHVLTFLQELDQISQDLYRDGRVSASNHVLAAVRELERGIK